MVTLFDLVFEITPDIENSALILYKSFCRYSFIAGKDPVSYEIVFDSYTSSSHELSNKYNLGLLVTRYDNTKVFLYYRPVSYSDLCLNYFEI